MTERRPSVDPRCYDLAEAMLADLRVTILRGPTDDEVWELAGAIQLACEDHLLDIEAREHTPAGDRA